jgi:pimeloyl-ACP methyl ester carboxylesterase
MTKRIILVLIASLFTLTALAAPVVLPTNKDGSIITGVATAGFDPLDTTGRGPVYPYPFNLFFLDLDTLSISDYTLNIPAEDETDFGDPAVALSAIDGFSTIEKWTISFYDDRRLPAAINPASVQAGQSVRLFQVNTSNLLLVTGVVRELVPNVDYIAQLVTGNTIAIIPLKPLQEITSYMAVLTNDIKDTKGNDATPDTTYYLTQQTTPWVDENGHSTYSLVTDDLAATLEVIRNVTNSMEAAAEAYGVVREDIIVSWTAQTQSITPVLKNVRSLARPAATTVGPTGMTTQAIGGFGLADIYAGIITIPYYLGVPTAQDPLAPLEDFWTAEPGAYVAPFDAQLPDKTSTHVTVANPFPILTSMQTVPLIMTVPNANSQRQKPAAGWPVIIYAHGVTRNRTDMLAIADTAAQAGYAVIAIDAPLHGLAPDDPLHVKNGPFADFANERTFDVDYVNNITGAPGPDGIADSSGAHMINLASMLTSRDNLRQGEADLSILAVTIPRISYDGDMLADLDGSSIQFVGQSMGAIMGTAFLAVEPTVNNGLLSVPMGGIPRGLEASQTFGPRIRAGLAAAGVLPGTADFERFFLTFQTVTDASDPINWSAEAARYNNIMLHEVINDTVVPNRVPTAPLAGTEPMIDAMGLTPYSSTQYNPEGLDVVGRFVPPANHLSLIYPVGAPETTAEMQRQMASFLATLGTTVQVVNESTMVPEVDMQMGSGPDLSETGGSKKVKNGKGSKSTIDSGRVSRQHPKPTDLN